MKNSSLIAKSITCLISGELIVIKTRLNPIALERMDNNAQIGMNIRLAGKLMSIKANNRANIEIALIDPSIDEYNNWDLINTEVLTLSAVKPPFVSLMPLIPALKELENTP